MRANPWLSFRRRALTPYGVSAHLGPRVHASGPSRHRRARPSGFSSLGKQILSRRSPPTSCRETLQGHERTWTDSRTGDVKLATQQSPFGLPRQPRPWAARLVFTNLPRASLTTATGRRGTPRLPALPIGLWSTNQRPRFLTGGGETPLARSPALCGMSG